MKNLGFLQLFKRKIDSRILIKILKILARTLALLY